MSPDDTMALGDALRQVAAQHARAEALAIACQTVRAGGGPVEIPELIDVAEYVINGIHPLDRYDATETSGEDDDQ